MNDITKKNKIRSTKNEQNSQRDELEVSGLTVSGNGKPNMEFATDEQDMDLIDQLYFKPKHRPLRGEGASYWDQD